jgi:hypothetical protein
MTAATLDADRDEPRVPEKITLQEMWDVCCKHAGGLEIASCGPQYTREARVLEAVCLTLELLMSVEPEFRELVRRKRKA